ncbi:hypothetical protein [Microbacterium sp.]|jgi:hypothetical protein|uniref:hypothetical protein n=1 Tax=Microbacterium sp. TaxID=51671 RepID=UPI0027273672|nr:hypothetical protein [Microbacterium sp.]MDO8384220.1 hypothetical protein [Microbacterium sp.]
MSTPEQPLTRKKLRELHATGSLPVQNEASNADEEIEEDTYVAATPPPAAPLARAATPAFTPPAPMPDAHVDLGVSPLTRRQAREQERIRTASVPVITPDVIAAQMPVSALGEPAPARYTPFSAPAASGAVIAEPAVGGGKADEKKSDDKKSGGKKSEAKKADAAKVQDAEASDSSRNDSARDDDARDDDHARGVDLAPVATVNAQFGAHLLKDEEISTKLPASFDELIVRNSSSTGAIGASSALILSQTPSMPPLSGPVNATGEVLITGTFHLPDGLGSAGGDPRSTDGKDVDSVLIDGELPASSSPTPIAASAAISTVRGTGEIIRPPAPEKGGRLLFSLAITAGVLALALVGVLILAFVNGAL